MRYQLSWPLSFCAFRLFNSLAAVSPTPNVWRGVRSTGLMVSAALAFVACSAGCAGGGSPTPPPPSQAVVIATQPVSQVIAITQTATFTVTASGTAPLSYQWSENGTPIPGATGASYTTPPVALGANGSTSVGSFQVTVSNSVNSVTSSAVTLTAGARAPKPGDIRYLSFEQVSLPGFWGTAGATAQYLAGNGFSYANSLGTPLWIGNSVPNALCSWHFEAMFLPPPMDNMAMYYQEYDLTDWAVASILQSVAAPYKVITSMDIQPPGSCAASYTSTTLTGAVGMSWIETSGGNFDQRLEAVSPSQVQAQATADGQASRIITAAAFDPSGNVDLISYGWTGDTTTVYEAQTYLVPSTQVASTAATLATNGYFISAFGGNDTDGYLLIGMRVQGDTLPRAIFVNGTLTGTPDTGVGVYGYGYFTPVVELADTSCSGGVGCQPTVGYVLVNEQ